MHAWSTDGKCLHARKHPPLVALALNPLQCSCIIEYLQGLEDALAEQSDRLEAQTRMHLNIQSSVYGCVL